MRALSFAFERQITTYVIAAVLAFTSFSLSFSASAEPADVRVLIDISGSMKKNDPNNLRVPALNLLTELVPNGDQAGVWTFGQYVNMLVKHQKVDANWRKMAKSKAKEINSVALYTNIGGVLERAGDDLSKGGDFSNTHFILLTDGMVDIDKDPAVNLKERERILSDIAGRFKAKGARVHTIALSRNADMPLLEKMSIETGGVAAVAETPEDLTRIFLQAFDQAVPAEQVPLEGNTFDIDSSVEELTALIFRKEGSKPTKIVEPNDQSYGYGKQPDYVSWYQDKGYDLITIKQPFEGTWRVDADLLPDSRVTVVSNLKMTVLPLPVNFFAGDLLNVEVAFEEDGVDLTNADFLKLLDVDLNIKTEDGKSGTKRLSDAAAPPADGKYRDTISKLKTVGQYEVNVYVDGKTFKRKNRQIINLRSPLDVELAKVGEGDKAYYNLVISPLSDAINLEKTTIVSKIKAPDGSNIIKTIPLIKAKGRWELAIEPSKGDGTYQVDMKVKGYTNEGNVFQFAPRQFEATFPMDIGGSQYVTVPEVPDEPADESPEPEPVVEEIIPPIEIPPQLEQEAVVEPVTEPVAEPKEESDDLNLWIIIGSAIGAVLLFGGGFGYWLFKKRGATSEPKPPKDKKSKAKSEDEEDAGGTAFNEPEINDPPEEIAAAVVVDDDIEDELDFVEDTDEMSLASTVEEADELEQMVAEAAEPEPVDAFEEEAFSEDDIPVVDDIPIIEEEVEEVVAEMVEDEPEPEVDVDSLMAELGVDLPDEEDEEEFNLEDFDISETDGPVDEDKK